ncbi:MAG: hypothetical protein H8E82_04190 [Candidatus Marinimicrobia bacterium]|nr:hypothetical protein [Candidatus Neomarinimicrobiota bacterium]
MKVERKKYKKLPNKLEEIAAKIVDSTFMVHKSLCGKAKEDGIKQIILRNTATY